ncbi:spore coat associated protein CotJA [Alkalithermobacter paradoxus]|uniref:Spore coat associated protein CotJA n=1 Tax=Alkalithermobacter paradoxus TaxID=29349 RepID=A0A1V4I6Z5_9FIRM|nr:spore coat associated protein CotJA [[Clostridium] thermoalcaliphilum]
MNCQPYPRPINMGLYGKKLARAYVPNQPYVGMVPLDEALRRGSLFPNLYQPYTKKGVKKK